jgi:3-phosphoshikimate 1-carboxyvinyltransferase
MTPHALKTTAKPVPLISKRSASLRGEFPVPGDKSISHRALMLGAIASGKTLIRDLLEGEDVLHTAAAMRALGATIHKKDGFWLVEGVGVGQCREPKIMLEMGNSGTSTRLLMGLVATQRLTCRFDGDASLRKRPMARVMDPLVMMGANFFSREGGKLPVTVAGALQPQPLTYRLPVASAQVKSAILLAALNTAGTTRVIEAIPTRDHSEIMLRQFGANISVEDAPDGTQIISLKGGTELHGQEISVPADPSSSAFPMVAALLSPEAELTLRNIGLNPRRTGLITTLQEMGAEITIEPLKGGGEMRGDLRVRSSQLRGIDVPAERAPSMIDEYPILAIAASCAKGATRMRGLGELRVKESDRLAMIAAGLSACGADVTIEGDDLIVTGNGKPPKGGATIATAMDHRIAMSFLILGMVSDAPVTIDDSGFINTSFPNFVALMNERGAVIEAF